MTKDTHAFLRIRKDRDKGLAEVADILRSGQASSEFLEILAEIIDPRVADNPYRLKLHAKLTKRSIRDPYHLFPIGERVEQLIRQLNGNVESAVQTIVDKEGLSRSTVFAALKEVRMYREFKAEIEELKLRFPDV